MLASAQWQRPLGQGDHIQTVFNRHKKRIVIQPIGRLSFKPAKGIGLRVQASGGQSKNRGSIGKDQAVINPCGQSTPIKRVYFIFRQKSQLNQIIQINLGGVAGKSRKTLVRTVTKAGRTKRQDLPQCLTRRCKKVNKMIRCPADRADSIRRGQTADG